MSISFSKDKVYIYIYIDEFKYIIYASTTVKVHT